MKAALSLESIGDDGDALARIYSKAAPGLDKVFDYRVPRPWIAEITGKSNKFGFERCFLSFNTDYSQANGCGSRGVIRLYILESGKIYEIFERLSWRRSDRYFCCVLSDGSINRISKAEVEQWLESRG